VLIDRYAYGNHLRHTDPALKAGIALTMLALCLALNNPRTSLWALGWMSLLTVAVARIPAGVFGRILLGESTFLALATVGIAVTITVASPPEVTLWRRHIGSLWIFSTAEGFSTALHTVSRALGAVAAMNFLALTTPLVDLMTLLRRWHVPSALIDITAMVYRATFLLLDNLNRMRTAQECRLGYATAHNSMYSAALLGGNLFMKTFQQGRRLQYALDARGFAGELRVLPAKYRANPALAVWGISGVMAMLGMWRIPV